MGRISLAIERVCGVALNSQTDQIRAQKSHNADLSSPFSSNPSQPIALNSRNPF